MIMGDAPSPPEKEYLKLSTVTGYFLQDEPDTDPKGFDYVRVIYALTGGDADPGLQTTTNFGLKERAYDTDREFDPNHEKTQWQRFERQVDQLNHEGASKTRYKVLISSSFSLLPAHL
jgi:hypothetical protein